MEFSKKDMKILKGIAILFMLLLHLFGRKEVNGLYATFPVIHGVPVVYYIALFGDICVPIFCFSSGYGLYVIHDKKNNLTMQNDYFRILKLLVNYWIVLVIFVSIGFIAGQNEIFPGSLAKFLLNFFLLSNTYNGAWWFLQTYIILVLLAPLLSKIVKRDRSLILVMISGFIYIISYIQRFKHVVETGDNAFLTIVLNAIVLLGTSQFPFIVGTIFAKEKIYSKLYQRFANISHKNTLCFIAIIILMIIHSIYESMIVAPFMAIAFICLFSLTDKAILVKKIFAFFGQHSTNIWLTHMFFSMSIFPEITFAPKYPIVIFLWLIILSLTSSFAINLIYQPFLGIINQKQSIYSPRYSRML